MEHMLSKSGSFGFLLPNMEGRLVDDDGKDVGVGEPGELWVRGPNIMKCVNPLQAARSDHLLMRTFKRIFRQPEGDGGDHHI